MIHDATAGVFEDTYDWFKFSPAYLPGFERNAFWGQLSNYQSLGDQLFDDDPANDYYLLGGHMDVMGMGRAGIMVDWNSDQDPAYIEPYGGSATNGYAEESNVVYRDIDSDGTLDYRRELYGRGTALEQDSSGDVYAVYGMGGVAGFDLGAGVRMEWFTSQPTYNYDNWFDSDYGPFDWVGRERQYDLVTGQLLYTYDESSDGHWNLAYSVWGIQLGARSQNLVSGLDLVVDVSPQLWSIENDYEFRLELRENEAPADPNVFDEASLMVAETGSFAGDDLDDLDDYPLPGSGLGVEARVKATYDLGGGVSTRGQVIYETAGIQAQDAFFKLDYEETLRQTDWSGGMPAVRFEQGREMIHVTWPTAEMGMTNLEAEGLVLFEGVAWRVGGGVRLGTSEQTDAREMKFDFDYRLRYDPGTGDPSSAYTITGRGGETWRTEMRMASNTLALPVAVVFNLLETFDLMLGAEHVVTQSEYTQQSELIDANFIEFRQTYDDGTQGSPGGGPTEFSNFLDEPQATNASNYTVSHDTIFTYGASWWAAPDALRFDVMGFSDLLHLYNYRVSANIFF